MKVTNAEERCVKADRRLRSNETSIVRSYDLVLAKGYLLISPIIWTHLVVKFGNGRIFFYSLPLCKEGSGR